MYGPNASTYKSTEVLGTSREQLVPLMYRHLLANLKRADQQIRDGDLEGKGESLSRASEIVYELLAALDPQRGGEIANRLGVLYSYFLDEIRHVGRHLDLDRLGRMTALVDSLHEAWSEAARQVRGADDGTGRPTLGPTVG